MQNINRPAEIAGAEASGTYRFINAAHTLVLHDDHVIAWDPQLNQPSAQDEIKIWHDGGSPQPTDLYPQASAQAQPADPTMLPSTMPPRIEPSQFAAELDQVEAALPKVASDDIAGVREQLIALAKIVRGLVGENEAAKK